MSNWDDEDWEDTPAAAAAPAAAPAPTTGHPLSGGLGDWDDEDAESEPEQDTKKPSAPMKPSKLRAKALREKEEAEQQAEIARVLAREKELQELSDVQRKIRQQQIVEEADLENARDLFMRGADAGANGKKDDEPTIESLVPTSDAEYAKLAKMIAERVNMLNDNPRRTERYVQFLKDVLRGATTGLGPEDTKDLSSFLGLVSNEKRDEQKKARGIKKKNKSKTSVRVDKASDMRDDKFDDYGDDFM